LLKVFCKKAFRNVIKKYLIRLYRKDVKILEQIEFKNIITVIDFIIIPVKQL